MRTVLLWLLAVLAASAFAAEGKAERVTCIAPAKPDGGFDLTCRLFKDMLLLPGPDAVRQVDVRYMPGGIGAIAFDRAVTQRWSDPRTFVAFSTGTFVNLVQGRFGPHRAEDVRWLATLGAEYGAIAVRKDSPIQSLAALRDLLAKNPAGVTFAAGGAMGSQDWIKASLLVRAAGRDHRSMRFVSFEGGGQALAALKGGYVDVFCGDLLEAGDAFERGEVRLLALLAPHRLGGRFARVPTAREQGIDLVWETVRGVYMGPGVPDRDYNEWARSLRRVLGSPQYRQLLERYGVQPLPLVGTELDSYVREQMRAQGKLAASLHLRVP